MLRSHNRSLYKNHFFCCCIIKKEKLNKRFLVVIFFLVLLWKERNTNKGVLFDFVEFAVFPDLNHTPFVMLLVAIFNIEKKQKFLFAQISILKLSFNTCIPNVYYTRRYKCFNKICILLPILKFLYSGVWFGVFKINVFLYCTYFNLGTSFNIFVVFFLLLSTFIYVFFGFVKQFVRIRMCWYKMQQ